MDALSLRLGALDMKPTLLSFLSAAPMVGLLGGHALAIPEAAKPLVLLVLDTSAPMESSAIDTGATNCELSDANPPANYPYSPSRLNSLQTALSGRLQKLWCVSRGGIPEHFEACEEWDPANPGCNRGLQQPDGILDVYRDSAKFAFFTMDNNPGPLATDPDSYGPDLTTDATRNLGVRGPTAPMGAMRKPEVDESPSPLRAQVEAIQAALPGVRGTDGPVPAQYRALSPMVKDIEHFMHNDASITADPYKSCRPRAIVLFTSGKNNLGDNQWGWPTLQNALQDLKATVVPTVKVFIVGLSLTPGEWNTFEPLADPALPPVEADGLCNVSRETDLRECLSRIMGKLLPGPRTRTEPVFTNATLDLGSPADVQYQITAAYGADPLNPANLSGYVTQTIFRCASDCEGVAQGSFSCAKELNHIHQELNGTSDLSRDLRVILTDGSPNKLTVETLDQPIANLPALQHYAKRFGSWWPDRLPQIAPGSWSGIEPVPSLGDLSGTSPTKGDYQTHHEQLIDLVRARQASMRNGTQIVGGVSQQLGGVTRAGPVVLEPANPDKYVLPSWKTFTQTIPVGLTYSPRCRPTVLFIGTHDGLLHAHRIDHYQVTDTVCGTERTLQSSAGVGKELWAIMPQQSLKNAHWLVDGAAPPLIDGQIALEDIVLERVSGIAPVNEELEWRSMLVVGLGRGGPGYVALDVTDPVDVDDVKPMWEIDSSQRCTLTTCQSGGDSEFSELGDPVAKPAFAYALLAGVETALVVLSAGDRPPAYVERPELGKAVYILRAEDGSKLVEFSNAQTNPVLDEAGATATLQYPFVGSPIAVPSRPGVMTTRVFVGDAGGQLWRIDLRGVPTTWEMQRFFDPYGTGGISGIAGSSSAARLPIMDRPSIAPFGDLGLAAVVYGSGHLDYLGGSDTHVAKGFVVSLKEQLDATGNVTLPGTLNWSKTFGIDEKLTSAPITFAGTSWFTTAVGQATSRCLEPVGTLYGVDYVQDDGSGNPVARIPQANGTFLVSEALPNNAVGFGVQVVERPSCMDSSATGSTTGSKNTKLGAGTVVRGNLQLTVNLAKGNYASPDTIPAGVDPSTLSTKTVSKTIDDSRSALIPVSWGYVLY
jgi:hypothetical protein